MLNKLFKKNPKQEDKPFDRKYNPPFVPAPKRTKGLMNYKYEAVENPAPDCKWVRFEYPEQGTSIEIFLTNIRKDETYKEMISRARQILVDHDLVVIRDCVGD